MAALISSALHVGCAWRIIAAAPATCGDAIDVPERTIPMLPVPDAVETMLTPGAVMSGFRKLSPLRGPPDEKLANARKSGFAIVVLEASALPLSFAMRTAPSAPRAPKNGIVTLSGPVSALPPIAPSTGG